MAENFNFVQELYEIVSDTFKQEIESIVQNQKVFTNAELLLKLCEIFRNKVEIKKQERLAWGKYRYMAYSFTKKDSVENSDTDLMVYGAQLIYTMRKFLNDGEEIVFHMASKDSNGKHLADAYIPQAEILRNLHQVGQKGIGLTKVIQKELTTKDQFRNKDMSFSTMWKMIEYLADPMYKKEESKEKMVQVGQDKKGDPYYAYQSIKKDFQVYISFKGKNHVKYYDLVGNRSDLISFNNGWLFEWFDAIYNSGDEESLIEVKESLKRGSLQPLFFNKDYIPGTKQGDYKNAQGIQVQNKYGNLKIISYNNILKILDEFTNLLRLFITDNNDISVQNNLLGFLRENFIPETAYGESKALNKDLENKLLNNLSKTINFSLKII